LDWVEFWRAYGSFLSNPAEGIHHILAAGAETPWQGWVRRRLSRQATRLRGQTIVVNLSELVVLPAETLGGAYARHMLELGFDPNEFTSGQAESDWLGQRMAIGHDLYHIVAGFDASPLGEFGVAAFTLVQYWDLLNVFVLSFVLISLTNPRWFFPLLKNLRRGFKLGFHCQPIVAYPYELNWDKPLTIVREELAIAEYFH
jgi:ubiquinone biosynthesis protein Coq4